MDSNAHVVDGGDDLFDLIGVNHAIWQMIVDFSIGQVALFLAFDDKFANSGLLVLVHWGLSYGSG